MSIYFLAGQGWAAAAESRVLPLYTGEGFQLRHRRRLGPYELVLLDNPEHSVIITHETNQGDFIAAVGPFLFRGRSGPTALADYLESFRPSAEDFWEDTEGHFTLIVSKKGRTFVFCDGLGAHKLYGPDDLGFISNAFLASVAALPKRRLDGHGCYAYAWSGACYGGRTFIEQVGCQPANSIVELSNPPLVRQAASPILGRLAEPGGRFDDLVHDNLDILQSRIQNLAKTSGGNMRVSFSGGFDSRLLLATTLAAGVEPTMFVYGSQGDVDVRIAETVAQGEGLRLNHVDKDATPAPDPDAFPEMVASDAVVFDGWKTGGLIDNGSDQPDRRSRHIGGAVPLNGGLGEIYRNFYNLLNKTYSAEDVVTAFYMSFDPGWATAAFDATEYRATLARQMRAELATEAGELSPQQAHLLYPLFRGRYWTARDAETNQRFGWMSLPYLEHACIAAAASIPLKYRNLGRVQQAMIQASNARVAGYPNAYGFSFRGRPPLRYRVNAWRSLLRPLWLRRQSHRFKRRAAEFPPQLQPERLSRIIDMSFPYMRRYFHPERIATEGVYNRIVTLEYLAERFAVEDA